MNITEILVPAQENAWLPWAVQYFFYIGSAYGAALLLALALFNRDKTSHALRATLALVLMISALVGPLALTAELHQPGRAWHFFAYLTPTSWMSRGAVLLPLFSLLSVFTAWLYLRADIQNLSVHPNRLICKLGLLSFGRWQTQLTGLKAAALATALSGLSIAVYTGAEIAVIGSRPLWNQLTSPLLWFITAFLGAGGLTLLMLMTLKRATPYDLLFMRRTVMFAAAAACVLFPIWLINGGADLLSYDIWRWRAGLMTVLFMVCGFAAYRLTVSYWRTALTGLVSIAACWSLRWITIMDVQAIPRYDAGFYAPAFSWDYSGVMGIVGMAGLWIALAVTLSGIVTDPNLHFSQASTVKGDSHE